MSDSAAQSVEFPTLLAPDDPRHGTSTGYKRGCRCDSCRRAIALANRAYRNGRRVGKGRSELPLRHGSITAYSKKGCRCDLCRLSWRDYQRITTRARRAGQPIPRPSVCIGCGRDFMPAAGGSACSNACASKAWRVKRRMERSWTPNLSPASRQRERQRAEREVRQLLEARPELAELVHEQREDARRLILGGPWQVSLDAFAYDDVTWYELIAGWSTDAWTEAVCVMVDRRREIDAWADAA